MSPDRFDTSDLIQNQHEPGSRKKVLKNLLVIKRNETRMMQNLKRSREPQNGRWKTMIRIIQLLRTISVSFIAPGWRVSTNGQVNIVGS